MKRLHGQYSERIRTKKVGGSPEFFPSFQHFRAIQEVIGDWLDSLLVCNLIAGSSNEDSP